MKIKVILSLISLLLVGNAFAQEFSAIWNGERYQQFRKDFETDVPPDPCRGCGLLWSI